MIGQWYMSISNHDLIRIKMLDRGIFVGIGRLWTASDGWRVHWKVWEKDEKIFSQNNEVYIYGVGAFGKEMYYTDFVDWSLGVSWIYQCRFNIIWYR